MDTAATLGKTQHPTLRQQLDGELSWLIMRAGPGWSLTFPERTVG
jgi:hypothetical protein